MFRLSSDSLLLNLKVFITYHLGVRIKRKTFVVFLIASAITYVLPANAMMGGQDATGDERVVAIIPGIENGQRGCSGALVSPRVVFTAAHCLSRTGKYPSFDNLPPRSGLLTQSDAPTWVARPGIVIPVGGTPDKVKVIAQFASPLFQDSGCDNGDRSKCHGPRYDFGILVLEKPLGTKTFGYATSDEISTLNSEESSVFSIGYGLTSYAESKGEKRNQNPNKSNAKIRKSYVWGGDELLKPFPTNMIVQIRMPEDVFLGGGDSGSPLWFEKEGKWIFIGALSGAQGPTPSSNPSDPIWNNTFWSTKGTVGPGGQYFAALAFPDVIEAAEKFLAEQISREVKDAEEIKMKQDAEAKAAADLRAQQDAAGRATSLKKITITCFKGKLVKNVTAVKPACPKGFKKK
jgi:hypothetical protein